MKNTIKYIRLTDRDHYGVIIKKDGDKYFGYVNGEWKQRGMGIGYFYPDAPEFECYEYISEQEALKALNIA